MSRSPTPLPELEQQLLAAARRLDAPVPAKRRWWLHGWSLLSIVLVAACSSVAVARVAEVGPFAYMANGVARENPKLAPTSTITVVPDGAEPRWLARADINGLNQLCITGGPRDPRTSPDAKPTTGRPNNAPQNGRTCTDSLGVAELLVDAGRPGATFAVSSELDGSLQGHIGRVDKETGRLIPAKTDPPTRLLVYGVRRAGDPAPVVRWYSRTGPGEPIAMRPSAQRLRMTIDHSPDGLSAAEQRIVAGYPAALDLVMWAAEVKIPRGARWSQVASPAEFGLRGVDDATIPMMGSDDLTRLYRENKKRGWKHAPGIRRDPPPVRRINATQLRWIAAFSRPRRSTDEVPQRLRDEQAAFGRFGYPVSRRLQVVGGGLGAMWIAPGGMTEDMPARSRADQICLLGSPLLRQCKYGQRRWKQPFVEAVSCTQGRGWPKPLADGRTLVWALTPPGATTVELRGPGDRVEMLPAGELLAVRRPASERIAYVVWVTDAGKRTRVRVPWPKSGPRCAPGAPGDQFLRKDNAGSSERSSGRPPGTR